METVDDEDWLTREAARVSLTNLTGMEFPLSALASSKERAEQAGVWRKWWAPADRPPPDVVPLLGGRLHRGSGLRRVTVSTTYRELRGQPTVSQCQLPGDGPGVDVTGTTGELDCGSRRVGVLWDGSLSVRKN